MNRTPLQVLTAASAFLAVQTGCGDNPHLDRVAELRGPREGTLSAPLPDPTFLTISGDSVRLHDYLGEALTLISFGGTWCPPCEREMPELERLHEEMSSEGVTILAVVTNSPQEDVDEWIDEFGLTLPILHGIGALDWADLRLAVRDGVPYTVLVDSDGRMTRFFRGFRDHATISALLRDELRGSPGTMTGDDAGWRPESEGRTGRVSPRSG